MIFRICADSVNWGESAQPLESKEPFLYPSRFLTSIDINKSVQQVEGEADITQGKTECMRAFRTGKADIRILFPINLL